MKTPKEKAEELVEKFKNKTILSLNKCKECALIVVEEIINDNPNIYDSDRLNYKYWNEVRNQLEKLS